MLVKINCLILILFAAAAGAFAQQASSTADTAKDDAAVRQIVKQLEDAWNAHDGKAFAARFAADADYIVIDGMYAKGREAIEKGHQGIFTTIYKDSTNRGTVKSVRFLRPDIAIVHVEWNLTVPSGGKENKGSAMNTLLMANEKGTWSIAAFQNTPVRPVVFKPPH
jgi:uncharacterized protein (TIGR02246 family)